MRQAKVFRNGKPAGTLTQYSPRDYEFRYDQEWLTGDQFPAISLTLPKQQQAHRSTNLFPFFFNMLSEGANKQLQCRQLKIDENDFFSLLLATAGHDTVGAVTIQPLQSK